MSEWISVEDKLPPDKFDWYLVVLRDPCCLDNWTDHLDVLGYDKESGWLKDVEDECVEHCTVTHWMALPSLPEMPPR